jgi:hypothetical protein
MWSVTDWSVSVSVSITQSTRAQHNTVFVVVHPSQHPGIFKVEEILPVIPSQESINNSSHSSVWWNLNPTKNGWLYVVRGYRSPLVCRATEKSNQSEKMKAACRKTVVYHSPAYIHEHYDTWIECTTSFISSVEQTTSQPTKSSKVSTIQNQTLENASY